MIRTVTVFLLLFLLAGGPIIPMGEAGEYDLDLSETEKRPYRFSGYLEIRPVLIGLDEGAALYKQRFYDRGEKGLQPEIDFGLQLEGSYEKGTSKVFARINSALAHSYLGWSDSVDLFEGYISLKPAPTIDIYAGKKTLKWGKGYAWNPAAFLDRPKNPDDPELNLEGFWVIGADYIRSFSGPLKTFSFTPILLPTADNLNEDFGEKEKCNWAGKLYFLFYDTDIDFLFLGGGSKSPRYGMDFSRNLGSNLEIHGELAWVTGNKKPVVDAGGRSRIVEEDIEVFLLGMRYLSKRETTIILEYYHNGGGYTEGEMRDYFSLIEAGHEQYRQTGSDVLLQRASALNAGAFGRPNPMRDYLYMRVGQKDPFNILYFTPALSGILNLQDKSFSLSPEAVYTGFTNWEIRLKGTWVSGKRGSEYGEKPNDYRIEFRVRYFF